MQLILKHIFDCLQSAFLLELGRYAPKPTGIFLDLFDVVAVA